MGSKINASSSADAIVIITSPLRAGLNNMEKVQQDNDPNWYSKQPKCNTTHHYLLNTE